MITRQRTGTTFHSSLGIAGKTHSETFTLIPSCKKQETGEMIGSNLDQPYFCPSIFFCGGHLTTKVTGGRGGSRGLQVVVSNTEHALKQRSGGLVQAEVNDKKRVALTEHYSPSFFEKKKQILKTLTELFSNSSGFWGSYKACSQIDF